MKYAVHVTTRDEQDYVSMKLYNKTDSFNWNYITNDNDAFDGYRNVINNGYEIISFNEFKSRYEPQLKIGDTFEKDGFVCRVESEVEKWVYDKYQEAYYKTKEWYSNYIVITDKEFIAQLEKYS